MSKKIAFMGTPSISGQILKSLYQNGFNIEIVYTQPPVLSNRGHKLNKSPVHIMAEILNIPVRTPVKLDNLVEKKFIKSKNIDLGIVVAYGQILKKDILALPKFGWINIHYSLLPKLRGAAPIQRAIMNNENLTGISIMKMDEGLDTGPVCNQYPINILDNENSEDLSKRLSSLASEKSQSSYAKKIKKEEGKIIWQENNKKIIGKINGLYPNPGGWFEFQGERYKIHKAELSINTGKAGYVLSDNLEIGCGENSIKIIEIQRQGKKVQKTGEFLLGSQIKKGTNLN